MMMRSITALLLFSFLLIVTGEKLSLNYCYTMQYTNSESNLYDCTVVTLLNDTQIYFYNSADPNKTPKPHWLKISETDWIKSTTWSDGDRQWMNKVINIQSSVNKSVGHVLQWNLSCEGERHAPVFSSNEFGFDGENLIYFNCTSKTWLTPENKKNPEMEQLWNQQYRQLAVEKCVQCEEMLKMYLNYNTTDLTPSHSPTVYIFQNKSVSDSSELILTCMATGFYPKDVKMSLMKFTTEIPDHLITSSGVRPNHNGTYQLRKSVEILEDEKDQYECYVSHSSLTEPKIEKWEDKVSVGFIVGVAVAVVAVVILFCGLVLFCALKNRKKKRRNISGGQISNGGATDRRNYVQYHKTSTEQAEGFTDGGRNRPSHPTSNVQINDTNGHITKPLLQHEGLAASPPESPATHPRKGLAASPPESPATHPSKGLAASPPEGPATNVPEGPTASPPESPATHPPEGPATNVPEGPTASPPESPATHPPEGPATHPSKGLSASPPDGPPTHPSKGLAASSPEGPATNVPEGPTASPPESPATHPPEGPATHPSKGLAASPPEGPTASPPESPATHPPEGPAASPTEGAAISQPHGPATHPPEGSSASPPESPATHPPEGPATSPTEGPAFSQPDGPATHPPEGPAASPPESSVTNSPKDPPTNPSKKSCYQST
ncbi:uncharacterized protein LOC125788866 isoform X2 [Astyanax mexicanus]|uniref:uncharacterized protein LOC125788866 isoform X2 n=1 Tax=Astyanax mexicanus TaxID=7994 RepID=UPI0020CB0DA7|nr:uncharacterized protein LOC125788866 isoform X2 [Astyanax mexicanus]